MAEFIKKPRNTYLFGLLALFITLYGPRLSPKLPEPVQELFEKTWFRAAVMFLAVYLAQRDFRVSLLVTVVFLVLMNIVQNTNVFETFLQNYQQNIEGFATAQLTAPEKKCAQTIGSVFKGQTIDLPETHSNIPDHDNIVSFMAKSSDMALKQGDINGINRARSWCQQFGNSTAMHGVPSGQKVVAGCNLIENDCNKNKWLADTDGSKVKVPKFYQGTCAHIVTDPKNWVIKKPSCFNKKDPSTSGVKCNGYSQTQCQQHKDDCFWGDDIKGFKNSSVKIPGGDHTVVCVPQQYVNTGCAPNITHGKNVAKNAKDGVGSYKFEPQGCVTDMLYNNTTLLASMPEKKCVHSGQCCGYNGESGKKGSYCIKSDKGNFCMSIDPTTDSTFDQTFTKPAFNLTPNNIADNEVRLKQIDVENLSRTDFKQKTGSYEKLISDPSSINPSFGGKGANWQNVYYGDNRSKATNPSAPSYPKNLYTDNNGQMGLGCWVPETGIPAASKFYAQMSPREGTTAKQQMQKKEDPTANLRSGFGTVGNVEQFQGSQNVNEVTEGFVGGAPPVSNCNVYNPEETKFTGTAFYPLNDNNQLQENYGAVPNHRPAYSGEVNWDKSVNA